MDLNAQKEEFSYAYVRAVASVAGYSVSPPDRPMDNAGIDLTIKMVTEPFPLFDAQVKCTSSQSEYALYPDKINYKLKVKNYESLISQNRLAPIILILVIVPDELEKWLNISEEDTVIKKCGYWVSLQGKPATKNQRTVTVEIPRKNLFTPKSLSSIMNRIVNREEL